MTAVATTETTTTKTTSPASLTAELINSKWEKAFPKRVNGEPAVLPVIHVKNSSNGWQMLENNIRLVIKYKFHGVFLINHGFHGRQLVPLIIKCHEQFPDLWIGANFLGCSSNIFQFLKQQKLLNVLNGLWVDNGGISCYGGSKSISNAENENDIQLNINSKGAEMRLKNYLKHGWNGLYFGGVDFKYQSQLKKSDFQSISTYIQSCEQLASFTAKNGFMDCVCTTGKGTGHAADLDKMQAFRNGCGSQCKLSIASGVNPQNVESYLPFVDAILVATGISSDFHNFNEQKMAALRDIIDNFFLKKSSSSESSSCKNTN